MGRSLPALVNRLSVSGPRARADSYFQDEDAWLIGVRPAKPRKCQTGRSELGADGLHPHGSDLVDGVNDRAADETLLRKVMCDPLSAARSVTAYRKRQAIDL